MWCARRAMTSLGGAGPCRACGVAVAGGYRRCYAMEGVVEFVRAACPNAAYGCGARPACHCREEHLLACPHTPCHCPGGEACGFVGSKAALLDHVASAHGWPLRSKPHHRAGPFVVRLRDGFNFVVSDDDDLLLLNVTRHPSCRAVSVVCIRARSAAAKEIRLGISYGHPLLWPWSNHGWDEQKTVFIVACSDLSDRLPDSNDCHQIIVPEYIHGDSNGDLEVTVEISTDEASCYQSCSSESSDMEREEPPDVDYWSEDGYRQESLFQAIYGLEGCRGRRRRSSHEAVSVNGPRSLPFVEKNGCVCGF